MVEFRILVDLVVAADTQEEVRDSLGSCGVDFGGVSSEDVDREAFPEGLREGLAGTVSGFWLWRQHLGAGKSHQAADSQCKPKPTCTS